MSLLKGINKVDLRGFQGKFFFASVVANNII